MDSDGDQPLFALAALGEFPAVAVEFWLPVHVEIDVGIVRKLVVEIGMLQQLLAEFGREFHLTLGEIVGVDHDFSSLRNRAW